MAPNHHAFERPQTVTGALFPPALPRAAATTRCADDVMGPTTPCSWQCQEREQRFG